MTPYHHGDLKQTLIDCGIRIIESEGFDKLSLRNIARKAGVSQTAPYSHFKDKSALLASIAQVGFIRLTEALKAGTTDVDHPKEKMMALQRAYILFATEHPRLYHMMFGPRWDHVEEYPDLQNNANASFELLLQTIAHLIKNDDEEIVMYAAISCWSMVHGLTRLIIDGQLSLCSPNGISGNELTDIITGPLLDGLLSKYGPA